MPGKTNAELTEDAYMGAPSPAGGVVDHVLLQRDETNKVLHDGKQARAIQAWLLLYGMRVAWDNRVPHWHTVTNPMDKTDTHPETYIRDNWKWMYNLYSTAMDAQLTMLGYSREQFLRHAVSVAHMGEDSEPDSKNALEQLGNLFNRK